MRISQLFGLFLSTVMVSAAPMAAPLAYPAPVAAPNPDPIPSSAGADNNPRDYLIIFEKGFDTPDRIVHTVAQKLKEVGASVHFQYHTVIKGFSVSLAPSLVSVINSVNDAEYPFIIEQDKEAKNFA